MPLRLATESSAGVPRPSGLLVLVGQTSRSVPLLLVRPCAFHFSLFLRCRLWPDRLRRTRLRRRRFTLHRLPTGGRHAAELFQFPPPPPRAHIVQAELNQGIAWSLGEDRLADHVLAPGDGDQL